MSYDPSRWCHDPKTFSQPGVTVYPPAIPLIRPLPTTAKTALHVHMDGLFLGCWVEGGSEANFAVRQGLLEHGLLIVGDRKRLVASWSNSNG